MKFVGSFLSLMALTIPSLTGAATLEDKWKISDNTTFTYDSLNFTLGYKITDFIVAGQAKYELYTYQCYNASDPSNLLTSNDGIDKVSFQDTTNAAPNNNPGAPNQDVKVNLRVNSAKIASSRLYSEDTTVGNVNAQVKFCVRFGLWTPGTTPTEVNFLETLVTLNADLSDGFNITAVAVAPKDKLVRTAAQAYKVEGYICDEQEKETSTASVRNQGAQIRVCVRPDKDARDDGIYMRSIDNFSWTRTTPTTITQEAVVNKVKSVNTLTELYCQPGELVCQFVSILFASFYATAGSVGGSGTASMQFGGDNTYIGSDGLQKKKDAQGNEQTITNFTPTPANRRLRKLQEDEPAATSEFDLSFDIDQGTTSFGSASGATSVATMAMSVMAAAGAVLMI